MKPGAADDHREHAIEAIIMISRNGFTLIELLLVVTIIALLGAIAYPSYREQVSNSRRSDCGGTLMSLGNAMERFYTVNNTYLGAAAGGNNTGAPAVMQPTTCPADGGDATYNLTIQAATATTYTIQAAPTGAQTGDRCGTLTLNNRGVKGITGADAGLTWEDCWR
jgi:type IV pilus assembly protein PilE